MIKPHITVPFEQIEKYFQYIKKEELNLEIYFGSRIFDDVRKRDIIELKTRLDYNPRFSIHAPYMDLSPGAVDRRVREVTTERFSDVLSFAEILKPEMVVFHSGYEKWKYAHRIDIWLEESLKTWRPLQERAQDIGVRIAIENVFEDEPLHLKLLMEEMKSENFGLCFDTGHFNLFSTIPLKDWLELTKPFILELHLHDNTKTSDSHFAIGDGNFDFRTLFRELKGENHLYTIEAHTPEDVRKSMERLQTYVEKP